MRFPRACAFSVLLASVFAAGCTTAMGSAESSHRPASVADGSGVQSAPGGHKAVRSSLRAVLRPQANGGIILLRTIPSSTGFRPQGALLYLPPVWRTDPALPVPVLELLHGTPGAPLDWFTRGELRRTADAYAAAHNGVAPMIVLPDINGSRKADTECIRTADGKDVETYLTDDVERWVRRAYPAVGTRPWWIAGLSEGGICAAVLALRHPDQYDAFGDLSGLSRPIVEHHSVAASDKLLYDNDPRLRDQHDPTWLLTHRPSPRMRAYLACGASDTRVRRAQTDLEAALRRARVPLLARVLPGKHTWSIWRDAFRQLLPWLAQG